MSQLTIELGEPKPSTTCECCGNDSYTAYGFVYRDGDAYSVYHAAWSAGHPDVGVSLAIDLGHCDEDVTPYDRFRVGIQVWSTQDEIQFRFVDRDASAWGASRSPMLSAAEARAHPEAAEFFRIAEHVINQDPRLASFLNPPAA
jgi:hypothetical protein